MTPFIHFFSKSRASASLNQALSLYFIPEPVILPQVPPNKFTYKDKPHTHTSQNDGNRLIIQPALRGASPHKTTSTAAYAAVKLSTSLLVYWVSSTAAAMTNSVVVRHTASVVARSFMINIGTTSVKPPNKASPKRCMKVMARVILKRS